MENKPNRVRNLVEAVRTNVRAGWGRLVDRLTDFRDRWSDRTIVGETVSELGALAINIDNRVNEVRDNWNARGNGFRERLASVISEATDNLRTGYNTLRNRASGNINRFRREARDFGLGAVVNDRVRNAVGQVGQMVVEAADFMTELPLRTIIVANESRMNVEAEKINAIVKISKQAESNRPGWNKEVLDLVPAMGNMGKRFVEFGANAEKARIKLISLVENRERMRMERSLAKIQKLTRTPSFG